MLTALQGCASRAESRPPVSWEEIAALPRPPADHRASYGSDPQQFGELRLPPGPGPHPVAVVVHGGCWRDRFTLDHITPLSAALTRAGVATWTLEYRRVGNAGGGWPGTFLDVARGTDHLRELARTHPLDLSRVVTVGHSAGGHLALWLAARPKLPRESPLHAPDPLPLRGVVPLAAISDLAAYAPGPPGSCNAMVPEVMGGTPAEVPARYAQGSPVELLPLGVPVRGVHGGLDPVVPLEQSRRYEARARAAGDDARLRAVEGAGHFDVIAPHAPAYRAVEEAVRELTARTSS
jgi:acetyl esterase/lipase